MPYLTRAQRLALRAIFDRHELYNRYDGAGFTTDPTMTAEAPMVPYPVTYRTFRRAVQPGPDCIMIQWCGIWLGVEKDGYTHS